MKKDEDNEYTRNVETRSLYFDKEEHKHIRSVAARSYIHELMEEINKPVTTRGLLTMPITFNKDNKYSEFFNEDPRLSLWNRYAKDDNSQTH